MSPKPVKILVLNYNGTYIKCLIRSFKF